jgi:superfamily I DNA and RNA helicase
MAWMIREDQLDPDQREFINVESKKSGNIWVKGFAGSGKSVLLIHSLKNVLSKEPNAKIAVVVYTHSLIDMFKTGMKELNIPSSIPVMTYIEFCDKNSQNFDYIFCDEVQDLPSRVLYAMNNRSRKVIVAGDSNQSIYDTDPRWNEPVVNPSQVGDIINARAFSLNMIHRLTRSIIAAVQKITSFNEYLGSKTGPY